MNRPRFGNILLSGPCNLRCPDCIGRQLGAPRPANLDRWPLAGLDGFVASLRAAGIRQVSLSGTDTDPLLYRHQPALLDHLRREVPGVQVALHSNGQLALRRMDLVNRYDRLALSLPSLRPATCRAMTGCARPLDLDAIAAACRVPLKVSILVTPHNLAEIPALLARCRALGIRRAVLRRRHADPWRPALLVGHTPRRQFAGMPVYELDGLEVTVWEFSAAQVDCINLYSDGTRSRRYLLDPVRAAA